MASRQEAQEALQRLEAQQAAQAERHGQREALAAEALREAQDEGSRT